VHLLPLILLGTVLLLGLSIDLVSKARNGKSTPENIRNSSIQKDWYKPPMLNS
jgi:hypothetical protein